MKIVIIGGVAGGASAAARLRRLDEQAEIVIFERGEHISYANCGLPYYIGGEIKEREKVLIQTPESFKARFNIDVRVRQEVVRIDRSAKAVVVKDHATGREYRERYDKLVLSPGAAPLVPPIPGIENERIFTLRNVPDAERIKSFISEKAPKRAVVIGAGYIGLEMAENLHNKGIFVTIVEMAQQVIAPLDFEMAALVHQHLKTKNVGFYLGEQVTAFESGPGGLLVRLKSGMEIKADLAVLSIGIRPEAGLAKEAGLALGERGGIAVNEYLQTSDPAIYAVGDAIETRDPVFGPQRLVPLAGPANKQGRAAADNIVLGNTEKYPGTVATAIAKVFDLSAGVTGYSARLLEQQKIDFATVIIHSSSHAGYYPGAMPVSLKLNFSKTDGRIYGGQAVGYKGVDKAVEVLSLCCQFGLTVRELKNMDQAYAPPYSSAKSPVNMLGFVAENLLTGKVRNVSWRDVQGRDFATTFLLDVRNSEEVALGMMPGAKHIPLHELRARLDEVPKDKAVYVYCAVGLRAYVACRILMQRGYKAVYNITGGYKTWETATMKQSNEDVFEDYRITKDDDMRTVLPSTPAAGGPRVQVKSFEIDACGLQCPGPIMKLNDGMANAAPGDTARVTASDPGFARDVKSWCRVTGNELIDLKQDADGIVATIRKGGAATAVEGKTTSTNKTIIVFSDDFDRALAAFVIANGALAMGRKVTMFFTFWGLNILKKPRRPPVEKDPVSRLFALLLPSSMGQLKLSKLNMLGIGPVFMRWIMKHKNIDSLESMVQKALAGGVEIIACQMSMDIMGIKREELIDGITYGGVASYIEAAEKAGMNLFM